MDIVNMIISLVSGAVGGNIAGMASNKNLGVLANTVIGLIGGGTGEFILKALGLLAATATTAEANHFDISSLLETIGASGVSGGALTGVITFIKNAMEKNKQ